MNIKILTLTMVAASMMLTSVTANAWSNEHRYDQRYHHQIDHKQLEKLKKQQAKDHQQYRKQLEKQQAQREKARLKAMKHQAVHTHWQRGQYLPANYRSARYLVNDWRAYRLSAPARGNEWRRIDGRYIQVSRQNHQIYQVW